LKKESNTEGEGGGAHSGRHPNSRNNRELLYHRIVDVVGFHLA